MIYEINVRQYTPEGTFAALDRHLPRLDSLGVDILWIMPVQPIGKKNRKGTLGSYYSISDYTAINPEFGTAADFRRARDDAHRTGRRCCSTGCPNHTSFDHVWITAHPDWYVHRADGTIINARDNEGHDTDWTDVAELNYDNPAMRTAMIADMRWWLDNMRHRRLPLRRRRRRADGLLARGASRAHSGTSPICSCSPRPKGPQFYPAFDMTYGWEFHHLLNEVAQGKKPTTELDAYFARQRRDLSRGPRIACTSPAITTRTAGTAPSSSGWARTTCPRSSSRATAQLGMPLIYTGQEVSLRKRLRFFEKDTVDWSGPSLVGFYRSVFDLKHANAALWNGADGGEQTRLETDGGNRVYAFTRTTGENTVLVAVNFGDSAVRAHVSRALSHPVSSPIGSAGRT